MLRADLDIPIAYRRTLEWGGTFIAQKPRGIITIDTAQLDAGVADGALVGTVRGVAVRRDAALANGKFVYKNTAGTTIDTNV